MCSVTTNAVVDHQLSDLERSNDAELIQKRLIQFASEASENRSGALDIAGLHNLPSELKNIRKWRIGRHRIYYTGHHTQCSYHVFFIKQFKKAGVNDENERHFQRMLSKALNQPLTRKLDEYVNRVNPPQDE